MDREKELARAIEDRDMAEDDALILGDEAIAIEREYPDTFEERDDWNALDREINALNNEAMYLTSWIESYEQGYEE